MAKLNCKKTVMKKYIKHTFSLLLMVAGMSLHGQTTTENYVQARTYKVESQASLNTDDPTKVNTAIQYYDGLGRLKQSVAVKAGSQGWKQNDLPNDWNENYTWQNAFYGFSGFTGESIIQGTTPFGDTDLIWQSSNGGSPGANGGWTTQDILIDPNYAYRYSVWIKKTGNLSDGNTSHSISNAIDANGNPVSNAIFWQGDLPELDTWYLMVGYIHPNNEGNFPVTISGIYDTQGNKILTGTDYRWGTDTTTALSSNLFNPQLSNTYQYYWSPLFQKIDGNHFEISQVVTQEQVLEDITVYNDLVTHHQYDDFGRKAQEYLPYASNNTDGRFETNAKNDTYSYYLDQYPEDFPSVTDPLQANVYAQKFHDNTPLNRIIEQTAPGLDWKHTQTMVTNKQYSTGNTIKMDYDTNSVSDGVRIFEVSTLFANNTYTPTLVGGSSDYTTGELTKVTTRDENWQQGDGDLHTTQEFKNKLGQVILKRTFNQAAGSSTVQEHDTYYVYDDFGNLTFVLPPKMNASTNTLISINSQMNSLGYRYVYDYKNRLVEKKIADKGVEYIVYDKLDRPILTQDAVQRLSNQWLFTKYDPLGRMTYTGLTTDVRDRVLLQDHIQTSSYPQFEQRDAGFTTTAGQVYYTNNAFPTLIQEVYTINYYDSYVDLPSGLTIPTWVNGQQVTSQTQGLSTVSKVRILGENNWITTVLYYDAKARPIYTYVDNTYLQTTDISQSLLDFTGKVIETRNAHYKVRLTDSIITVDRFEYDHMDRLIEHSQKVNNQNIERIVENKYDDLGQLRVKVTANGTAEGYDNVSAGISIDKATVTKTGAYGFFDGFTTIGTIDQDGYVEFRITQDDKILTTGFIDTTGLANFFSIKYGVIIAHNSVTVWEQGTTKGLGRATELGDVIRIERKGNEILYSHNSKVFYKSAAVAGSLKGATALVDTGTIMQDFHIVNHSNGLQNIDYNYNVRGWLKNINQDGHNDNDLFNFSLHYNDPVGGTPLFNGNISQASWNTASVNTGSAVSNLYTYSYDALSRITSAIDNTGHYNLTGVSYDKNGNILTLQRKGHNGTSIISGFMDNLSYSYNTNSNQLSQVEDTGDTNFGFKNGATNANEYLYDVNGNMTKDKNKGIESIEYNHLNLPVKVSFDLTGNNHIQYVYDATGVKQKKIISEFLLSTPEITTTEYAGNYIYQDNTLEFFNHTEGYVKADAGAFDYVYQYKDHLGNVRLSYADANNDGTIDSATEIIEEKNYYPFGLRHKGYNNVISSNGNSVAQRFKYNGVELEESLGLNLYEMDLRQYDPAIGRWTGIDPVTHHSMSTYTAFDNNPAFWADPSGANAVYNWDTEQYEDENGNTISFEEALASNGLNTDGSEKSDEPEDDVTVNSEGIVTKVVKNNKPNRYFDEDGNELFFNDPSDVDKMYSEGTWTVGDRLFTFVSIKDMNQAIIDAGIIFERRIPSVNGSSELISWVRAALKSYNSYDFAENYLINLVDDVINSDGERNRRTGRRTTYSFDSGFFRFGNTNYIYNLYDGGNYMWGRAMGISGFTYGEIRFGSQANEGFGDTDADQRAIKRGFSGTKKKK